MSIVRAAILKVVKSGYNTFTIRDLMPFCQMVSSTQIKEWLETEGVNYAVALYREESNYLDTKYIFMAEVPKE